MVRRLIRWIARAEIADAQQKAFVAGAREHYPEGYNIAMRTMRRQMEEARAEADFIRALFPLYRPSKNGAMQFLGTESKWVH